MSLPGKDSQKWIARKSQKRSCWEGGGGHTDYRLVSTPGVGRSPPALTSSGLALVRQAAQFLSPKTVRSWSYTSCLKCIWSKALPKGSLPKQKLFEVLCNQRKAELQLERHFQVYKPQPNDSLFQGLISPIPAAGPSISAWWNIAPGTEHRACV